MNSHLELINHFIPIFFLSSIQYSSLPSLGGSGALYLLSFLLSASFYFLFLYSLLSSLLDDDEYELPLDDEEDERDELLCCSAVAPAFCSSTSFSVWLPSASSSCILNALTYGSSIPSSSRTCRLLILGRVTSQQTSCLSSSSTSSSMWISSNLPDSFLTTSLLQSEYRGSRTVQISLAFPTSLQQKAPSARITISSSGWIWSIFRIKHRNLQGLLFPPKVPPMYFNSMALSTKVSAVRAKHFSLKQGSLWILRRTILSIRNCGLVPWICWARGSVLFAMFLYNIILQLVVKWKLLNSFSQEFRCFDKQTLELRRRSTGILRAKKRQNLIRLKQIWSLSGIQLMEQISCGNAKFLRSQGLFAISGKGCLIMKLLMEQRFEEISLAEGMPSKHEILLRQSDILRSVITSLSRESCDYLKNLDCFQGLSFFFSSSHNKYVNARNESNTLVNSLKGSWRFSAENVDIIIMDSTYILQQHEDAHFNFSLFDFEANQGCTQFNDSLKHQILKQFKNECLRLRVPLTKTFYRVSEKYNHLKGKASRLIFIEDFILTAKIVWCSSEAFHNMFLNLEKIEGEQTPNQLKKDSMFVVTKIKAPSEQPSLATRQVFQQPAQRVMPDQREYQLYHTFKERSNPHTGELYIDVHRLRLDADKDCSVVLTDEDMEFFQQHQHKIKKYKASSKYYDELQCLSDSGENVSSSIVMPTPMHTRCNVCRVSFINYQDHIKSAAHNTSVQVSILLNKMISLEIESINYQKKHKKPTHSAPFIKSCITDFVPPQLTHKEDSNLMIIDGIFKTSDDEEGILQLESPEQKLNQFYQRYSQLIDEQPVPKINIAIEKSKIDLEEIEEVCEEQNSCIDFNQSRRTIPLQDIIKESPQKLPLVSEQVQKKVTQIQKLYKQYLYFSKIIKIYSLIFQVEQKRAKSIGVISLDKSRLSNTPVQSSYKSISNRHITISVPKSHLLPSPLSKQQPTQSYQPHIQERSSLPPTTANSTLQYQRPSHLLLSKLQSPQKRSNRFVATSQVFNKKRKIEMISGGGMQKESDKRIRGNPIQTQSTTEKSDERSTFNFNSHI